jgi:hypothetical protein
MENPMENPLLVKKKRIHRTPETAAPWGCDDQCPVPHRNDRPSAPGRAFLGEPMGNRWISGWCIAGWGTSEKYESQWEGLSHIWNGK